MDVSLRIFNDKKKQVAFNDDAAGSTDSSLVYVVPADGTYTIQVRDESSRLPTLNDVYRLSIRRQSPDFVINAPQIVLAPLGKKANLALTVTRLGGFTEPIDFQIAGLPKWAKIDMAKAKLKKGAKKLAIPITIDKTAASGAVRVQLIGTAKVKGKAIKRVASFATGGDLCPRAPVAKINDAIMQLTMVAPFKVNLIDRNRQRPVHRGTTYPAEFIIERDKGFKGAVHLLQTASQSRHRQGIDGPIITVPAKETKTIYPSFMPEWLETDRTTRMRLMGTGQVADGQGRLRYINKGANAAITMILEGALLKLSHQANELTVKPGASFAVPVAIARSPKLQTKVKVELVVPPTLRTSLQSTPIEIPVGTSRGSLKINTTATTRLHGTWKFVIRATTMQDGKWLVLSQTTVPVVFK